MARLSTCFLLLLLVANSVQIQINLEDLFGGGGGGGFFHQGGEEAREAAVEDHGGDQLLLTLTNSSWLSLQNGRGRK